MLFKQFLKRSHNFFPFIYLNAFSNLGTTAIGIGMREFTIATADDREREMRHREICRTSGK